MTAAVFAPSIIPPAPAHLAPSRQRDIIHSGELAIANGLRLIGRGTFTTPERDGAPLFVVNSASRAGMVHLVWVEDGRRIMCDCEARTQRQAFTCSHAQFVRMLIVAERATPASVPPAAVEPATAPEPAPAPSVEPARRVPCPTCGSPTDPAEVEQLGECLCCLQMRADLERAAIVEQRARDEWAQSEERAAQLPCWACGATATAETDHGLYCDQCVKFSPPALALMVQTRQKFIAAGRITGEPAAQTIRRAPKPAKPAKPTRPAKTAKPATEETARRIIARETARERAGVPSAASPRAARTARRSSQPAD